MLVVLCQAAPAVRAFFRDHPVPFPVAIDEDRSAAKAYGVYTLLGLDSIHIARPATFVVDRQGVIRRRFAAAFQWQRMPIERIVEALREIA
jgi:peroxiredoxin